MSVLLLLIGLAQLGVSLLILAAVAATAPAAPEMESLRASQQVRAAERETIRAMFRAAEAAGDIDGSARDLRQP
jgi:hypothetical protein